MFQKQTPQGVLPVRTCVLCTKPLIGEDDNDPQGPQFVVQDGKQHQVHADCYYDQLGAAVEQSPPHARRSVRGHAVPD